MLKKKSLHQIVLFFSGILLAVGILLSGIGFAMNDGVDYLKEDGKHKWYQIVYIDQDDHFHIRLAFGDNFQIMGF